MRDVLIRRVPSVVTSGLYAIPALIAATITVVTIRLDVYGTPAALGAAVACFAVRMVGVRLNLNAPAPPGAKRERDEV